MSTTLTGGIYLQKFLAPLQRWLTQPAVSEICANQPGEVWVETMGTRGMQRFSVPELTASHLTNLARQVAATSQQAVNAEFPLLSAALPMGRMQIALKPASSSGAFSIRKQTVRNLSLEDYAAAGGFDNAVVTQTHTVSELDQRLRGYLAAGDPETFLREAVRGRKNLIVAGGTSTGKTTVLNMISKEISEHERLITIEDTPEVQLTQPNCLSLLESKGGQGQAKVTTKNLLEASLRLRPDRIILGELRGPDAYTYLRAVNTGHPGSLTTLHANSPQAVFEQLAFMVVEDRPGLCRADILDYARSVVQIVVQLEKAPNGWRGVSEIYFPEATA